jgi:hypothetical protein
MVQVRNNMSSEMVFKNPEKTKNHKPAIAAGIVVGYNFLKDRNKPTESETSSTSSSTLSKGGNIAGRCAILAILSPVIAAWIGIFTNALIGFISIPVILVLCLIGFIYALNVKD